MSYTCIDLKFAMLKDLIGPVDFNYCGSIISHNSGTNLTSSDSYFLIVRVLSSNRKLNDNARAVTAASIDQDHPSSSASALQAITFCAEAQISKILRLLTILVASNAWK